MKTNFEVIPNLIFEVFKLSNFSNLDYELTANKNSLNLKINASDEIMNADSNCLDYLKQYISNILPGYGTLSYHNITIIGKTLILEVKI